MLLNDVHFRTSEEIWSMNIIALTNEGMNPQDLLNYVNFYIIIKIKFH